MILSRLAPCVACQGVSLGGKKAALEKKKGRLVGIQAAVPNPGETVMHPVVHLMVFLNGSTRYHFWDATMGETMFRVLTVFFVAVTILSGCDGSDFRGIPKVVQLDNQARVALEAYGQELALEHDLELLCLGTGGIVDDNKSEYCLNYVSRQAHTLDESRVLVTALARAVYRKAVEDPIFEEVRLAMAETRKVYPESNSPRRYSMKLSYRTLDTERPMPPLIAQARVIGSEVTFYYADPETEALVSPPLQETWELPAE